MIARTSCQHCGVNIEFEAENAGETVPCPSCGKQTRLLLLPPKPPSPWQAKSAPDEFKPLDFNYFDMLFGSTAWIESALRIFAGIDFFGAVIGGVLVGSDNSPELGFAVFAACVLSGFVLLGFASVIEHTKASAERLKRIEIILQQAVKK
jgi:hypothetical protein